MRNIEVRKSAFPPGGKPDSITAEYTCSYGDQRFRFDRPTEHTFDLVCVTKRRTAFDPPREGSDTRPPEKCFDIDTDYVLSRGIPEPVKQALREYADENCADNVTGDSLAFEATFRQQ